MIFLAVLLTGITTSSAQNVYNKTKAIVCDGIVFDGTYFEKDPIFRGEGNSYNLVMDRTSGQLFFSHITRNETGNDFELLPVIKACHLENRTCRDIKGIKKGFAIGYDHIHDNVYFGGLEGLYRYNRLTKAATFFGAKGVNIWNIHIFKTFYYVEFPTQQLYILINGKFVKAECINSKVFAFLANEREYFFSNNTGVYFVRRDECEAVYPLDNSINVTQIVEDVNGRVYFCADEGIYVVDKPFHKLRKIADVSNAHGLAFVTHIAGVNRVQYIYAHAGEIFLLQVSKYARFCLEVLLNPDVKAALRRPKGISLNLKLDFW